jgi:hypothetical protein
MVECDGIIDEPNSNHYPEFIFRNQTLAFGEPVTFLNSEAEVQVVMTMDASGKGFVVAGTRTVAATGWPIITPGPTPGSDIGGGLSGECHAGWGGTQLVETNCCTVCQNATQSTTIAY